MTTTLELTMGARHKPQHLSIVVRIIDEREVFGRPEVLVTPTHGSGEAWVSADRVKVRGK